VDWQLLALNPVSAVRPPHPERKDVEFLELSAAAPRRIASQTSSMVSDMPVERLAHAGLAQRGYAVGDAPNLRSASLAAVITLTDDDGPLRLLVSEVSTSSG